ncbi:MAG: universal stress protein [Nitrospirae bacterium]|nr:universal stress protein [Nitrospirota bacterium]
MKILIAYDGSEQADKALKEAFDIAGRTVGASITIVTVIPDLCIGDVSASECEAIMKVMDVDAEGSVKKVAGRSAMKGIAAEHIIRHGNPSEELLRAADEIGANLIVIGSHGKHATERFFFGSVSMRVMEHCGCNVLVIK